MYNGGALAASYVAIDLETTGLDFETDAIIEIGAVRFDAEGVLDTFQALVNPGQPIPLVVQGLTGIGDTDVAGAPGLSEISGEVSAFLGDSALVGHNVLGFDVEFLDRAGIGHGSTIYDTQELATLLLPGLTEYGLAALARHLGILMPEHHRAAADAETARLLFLALREAAIGLPRRTLEQASRWLAPTGLPWRRFLREALEAAPAVGDIAEVRGRGRPMPAPLGARSNAQSVSPEQAIAVLASARDHPEIFPDFDERAEQREMAGAVMEALNGDERLIVEAGTGVGKSLAYLAPAACHALAGNDRVVVSTATINLQEQLLKKDLPTVQALMGNGQGELRVCQLKGRRNYLCLKRFEGLRTAVELSDEEAVLATRVLIWLDQTESGDRAELRLSQGEEAVWRRMSAEGADCTAGNSAYVVEGSCFLQRARRQAEASHIVVVNHSLLLSDIATGGRVLPPYERLIVDEAHHLEEEATRQFGFKTSEREVGEMLSRCEGLASHVHTGLRGMALMPLELNEATQSVRQSGATARGRAAQFFEGLAGFVRQQATEGDGESRLLVTRGIRVQPDWPEVEIGWENLRLVVGEVISALKRLHTALGSVTPGEMTNYELVRGEVDALLEDGQAFVAGMSAAIEADDPERVVWIESERGGGGLAAAWAPLVVSDALREELYSERKTVVLTGATLRTRQGNGGDAGTGFGYIQERLGLEDARTLGLGSPFDYRRAAIALVPSDMPEPSEPEYLEALSLAVRELARASGGRALVLFTSHWALQAVRERVQGELAKVGITALGQGVDGSARQLVRALQADPKTVLLGTASFWEGVDVVGEALSLLVMARLPFNVPTEPVFAARSALYDAPFEQYAVPQAVLRFRQGFGRLIRSKTDRGVLVVLDRRIVSKRYGSAFLESLPGCGVREVMLREMPDIVEGWLGAGLRT